MIGTGLGLALRRLAVGLALVVALRAAPNGALQLVGLAVLAVTLPLAVVFLSGWVMFHMGDDVKLLAVAVAAASVALFAALLLARDLSRPIRRRAPRRRSSRPATSPSARREDGPAELAALARSFNEMAEQLAGRSSMRGASSWPGRATTFGRRLRRCGRCSRRSRTGSPSPTDYLPAMQEQVRTLAALVDDLFELARIDAGALSLELVDADCRSSSSRASAGSSAEAAARRVQLDARPGGGAGALRARQGRARALQPVTNALRHTPADGAVAVLRRERAPT